MSTLADITQQPIHEFTERAYLDYSMYVILDRALPHLGDGLKPVQRRIVYAMSELGLSAAAKYKKSARTVGDVLGKFHPHGDSACYEAMVLMAQPFSYRYPLLDGQGNWGSMDDPKSFAAMRYTEAKLAHYAEVLLLELGEGTVEWGPNFDGSLQEPLMLPARLPNVLLNGTTGIAVGMATDIPPHNLREVVSACIRLLDEPSASLKDLCTHIKGPDFPTDAEIITPHDAIVDLYRTGHGSLKMRAVYKKEDGEIIITALPHQTSGNKVLEQIAAQMQAKKLPMVSDLRDESDHHHPTRLVITPRSNRVDLNELMAHLFATTDLEKSYRVNMNMIGLDGRPAVKDLVSLLKEWLIFRTETVRRRLQFRLDKVIARLHILDGLLAAYLNIDDVIAIIRTEDKPKPVLMKRFELSDIQAEAILDLKLRHLAKLEEMKIRGEQDALNKERDELEKTLASKKRLNSLIRRELLEDAEKYGDDRRSQLVERAEARAIKKEDLIPSESITIVLSQKGWIRSAKGHDVDATGLNYKSGDSFLAAAKGRSNQHVIVFDSTGRSYAFSAHDLPSARGQGDPLASRLTPPAGAQFVSLCMADNPDQHYALCASSGYGFIVQQKELMTKNRAGKAVIKIPDGKQLLLPQPVKNLEDQFIAAITNDGYMLLFPLADLPVMNRGKGNKIINIPKKNEDEIVSAIAIFDESSALKLHSGKRHITLKTSDLSAYHGERGRRGKKLPRGFRKVDSIEVLA